jgi:2-keto-4-pentenoate hydratase
VSDGSPAALILDALDSGGLTVLPSEDDPFLDERSALSIAAELHERRLARGERVVGRKIGFTNRTLWDEYGVHAPIWGYVYDSTLHETPDGLAQLTVGQLAQPRLEPEIQLHFARTPPITRDERAILDCVDWIAHGFELVQSPYPDWRFTAVDAIAAGGLHGALVVGRPVPVADCTDCVAALRAFAIHLSRDGAKVADGAGFDVLGSPLLALAHLVEELARQGGEPIHVGEIVTTGTLTPPQPIAPGETWETVLDGIELPGMSLTVL